MTDPTPSAPTPSAPTPSAPTPSAPTPSAPTAPRVVVLMGVAGSGKSTVGRALAADLGWAFEDADAHHAPRALAKMARGQGLTDADRAPWLARLRALVDARLAAGPPTVLACSALRAAHRDALGTARPGVAVLWLDVPPDVLARRLAARTGHVAGPDLLPSQLDALEPPDGGRLDGTRPVATLVEVARRELRGPAPG